MIFFLKNVTKKDKLSLCILAIPIMLFLKINAVEKSESIEIKDVVDIVGLPCHQNNHWMKYEANIYDFRSIKNGYKKKLYQTNTDKKKLYQTNARFKIHVSASKKNFENILKSFVKAMKVLDITGYKAMDHLWDKNYKEYFKYNSYYDNLYFMQYKIAKKFYTEGTQAGKFLVIYCPENKEIIEKINKKIDKEDQLKINGEAAKSISSLYSALLIADLIDQINTYYIENSIIERDFSFVLGEWMIGNSASCFIRYEDDAGLVKLAGKDTFSCRMYPIPANMACFKDIFAKIVEEEQNSMNNFVKNILTKDIDSMNYVNGIKPVKDCCEKKKHETIFNDAKKILKERLYLPIRAINFEDVFYKNNKNIIPNNDYFNEYKKNGKYSLKEQQKYKNINGLTLTRDNYKMEEMRITAKKKISNWNNEIVKM